MKKRDRLVFFCEDAVAYRICRDHEGELEDVLCEQMMLDGDRVAEAVSRTVGVQSDAIGYYWIDRDHVKAALKIARAADDGVAVSDVPVWVKQALANGWKPPSNTGHSALEAHDRKIDSIVEENEMLRREYAEATMKLHKMSCEGTFSLNRDVMDLNKLFDALRSCGDRISLGKARECVRLWLAGLDYDITYM